MKSPISQPMADDYGADAPSLLRDAVANEAKERQITIEHDTSMVVLSVLVFFALCCQCVSTLAVIRRETRSWSWPWVSAK